MSELKEYKQIIQKILPIAVPLAVVGLLVGLVYTYAKPPVWEASTTLYVHIKTAPSGNVYDYDGYYAQQAAQQYATSLVGLLQTRDLATKASEIASSSGQNNLIFNTVQVKLVAPQIVSLAIDNSNKDIARKDLLALVQAASQQTATLNNQPGRTYLVDMVTGEPVLIQVKTNLPLDAAGGFAGGAVLGVLIAVVLEYFRR